MASPNRAADFSAMYKIVLVGDAGVGKTNMLGYYTAPEEDQALDSNNVARTFSSVKKPTVGVEFATKIITHESGARIKAQIWDTAGQERYRAITNSHYRRAAGALLVYDVSARSSFDNLASWIKNLRESAESNSSILNCVSVVGNKVDIENALSVSEEEQKLAVANFGFTLGARTSAKTGQGIKEAFEKLVIHVYENDKERGGASKGSSVKLKKGGGGGGGSGGCC